MSITQSNFRWVILIVTILLLLIAPSTGTAQQPAPTPAPTYLRSQIFNTYTVDIPECYWGSFSGGWVPCYSPQGTPPQTIEAIWSTTIRTFEFTLSQATWLALEVNRVIEPGRPDGWYIGNLGVGLQQLGSDGKWYPVSLPTTGFTLNKGVKQPASFDEQWAAKVEYNPTWQPLPPGQYRIFAWGQDVYDGNGALNAYWPSKGTINLYSFDNTPPPTKIPNLPPTPFKTPAFTPTPAPGDLRVLSLRIFQPFEGSELAAQRWTAVRVFADFIAQTSTTQTQTRVDLYVNGALFESRGAVTLKNQADYSQREIERGENSINFFLPPRWVAAGGMLQVRVVLDPENSLPEPDETNNSRTWSEPVFASHPLSLAVVILDPQVSDAAAQRWLDEARPFLLDTYPLPDVRVDYPFIRAQGFLNVLGAIADGMTVDTLRSRRGSQFGVGLFGGWAYGQDKRGFSHWLARYGPVVGVDWPYTLAHEIGHAYLGSGEEYDSTRDGISLPEGFLYKQSTNTLRYIPPVPVVNGTPQPEWINFMGDPHAAGINAWVNPSTYNQILHARESEVTLLSKERTEGIDVNISAREGFIPSPVGRGQGEGLFFTHNIALGSGEEPSPCPLPTGEGIQPPPQKLIVSGSIAADGTLLLNPLVVWDSPAPRKVQPGPYGVELYGADGSQIATTSFNAEALQAYGLDSPSRPSFSVELDYTPDTSRLVILNGGKELYRLERSPVPPQVTVDPPKNGTASWNASDADGDALTYTVFYSNDDGVTWKPLALYWTASTLTLDGAYLPGSSAARLRVIASDGLNFTSADSPAFTVAKHAPTVKIMPPAPDAAPWIAKIPNVLAANAGDIEDGSLPEAAYVWKSDRDGTLGQGHVLFAALSAGKQAITLTVTDADGQQASASITIDVQAQPPLTGLWTPMLWIYLIALLASLLGLASIVAGIRLAATPTAGGLAALQKEGIGWARRYQTGQVPPDAIPHILQRLRAQDRRGWEWAFDPFKNQWLRWDGHVWQLTPPPNLRGAGRLGWGLIIMGVVVILGTAVILGWLSK